MKTSRSFLMVTTIAVVGFGAGSAMAQPMTLTPMPPATPAQPAPLAQPAPPAPAAEPGQPVRPAEVDPRISYRPGEVLLRRLVLGEMALGERIAAVDTDGDGKISAAEFEAAAAALFAELDTNADGVLDDNDRREPAVAEGGDRGAGGTPPTPERRDDERRGEDNRGGMVGPNGGMMFFPGGPMFWGVPGMWFFAVPMGPQGGPDFRGGPNFEFRGGGPGGGDGGGNNGPNNGPNTGNGGPNFEFRMGPGGQGGGQWFYWEGPERRRD